MTTHNKTNTARHLLPHGLSLAIAFALAAVAARPAHAIDFGDQDGWHGSINTTLSYGAAMRVSDQSSEGIAKAYYDPLIGLKPNAVQRAAKGAFSANHDDGNLNYDSGDLFSNAVKGTTELHLDYGANMGAFVRASAFYDFTNADNKDLTSAARDQVGKRFRVLDSFVYDKFDIGGHSGSVRLGKQVLNWGESTFIQGGINALNAFDLSQLHVAGAELKEAYLPVNALWGSVNVTQSLSVEATYLLEFAQVKADPAGTYFSTNDFATLGGTYASLPFGLVPQPVKNADNYYSVCFGVAPSDRPSGCGFVLNVRSAPRVTPNLFCATSR
jgi:hypothetical protein